MSGDCIDDADAELCMRNEEVLDAIEQWHDMWVDVFEDDDGSQYFLPDLDVGLAPDHESLQLRVDAWEVSHQQLPEKRVQLERVI